MEAIFAPIQDVPDVPALDEFGDVRAESAIDATRFEGDFAAGLRAWPFACRPGDFATGQRTASVVRQRCDFATGLRAQRRKGWNRGDFATGLRRRADAVDRRPVAPVEMS
jgi:hypothetical protein